VQGSLHANARRVTFKSGWTKPAFVGSRAASLSVHAPSPSHARMVMLNCCDAAGVVAFSRAASQLKTTYIDVDIE
jgi:hypothetical protein